MDRASALILLVAGIEAGNGLLMVLAPAQFSGPAYVGIRPSLIAYGPALVLGGGAMCAALLAPGARFAPRAPLAVLLLVPLWLSFAGAGLITGIVTLGVQMAAALAAAFGPARWRDRADLLHLALGTILVLQSVAMAVSPAQFANAALYGSFGALLWLYGPAFALAGAGLLAPVGHTRPRLLVAAAVLGSLDFLALSLTFVGTRVWTGVVNYGAMAALLLFVLLPGPRRRRAEILLFGAAAVVAAIDLAHWAGLAVRSTQLVPDETMMRPAIALGVLVLGAAAARGEAPRGQTIAAIAGLVLAVGALQSTRGFDGVPDLVATALERRASGPAAVVVLALASAATALAVRAPRTRPVAAVFAMGLLGISSLGLLAHVVDQAALFDAFGAISLRLHTAVAVACLACGLLVRTVPPIAGASVGGRLTLGFGALLTVVALQVLVATSATSAVSDLLVTNPRRAPLAADAATAALTGLLLVITAAALLVSALVARSITAPLGTLTATLTRFGGGERGVRLESTRDDEFGGVARRFNEMADELDAVHEHLELLALHDALTGLPNRRLLDDRLGQAIHDADRRRGHAAVLVLDLDGFKAVNDRVGHAAGDELLIDAARRLRGEVRPADTVARTGGDEFVVVLPGVSPDDVAAVVTRIRGALMWDLGPEALRVTASVGVALFPADGMSAEALLNAADAAMYREKPKV